MIKFRRRNKHEELDFENILFDTKNISNMNTQQFEGVISKPISKIALYGIPVFFGCMVLAFTIRIYDIQIVEGTTYRTISEENKTDLEILFNKRGILYDRNGVELAWNEYTEEREFSLRRYMTGGFSHLLGYVNYPQKDKSGNFFEAEYQGVSGLEFAYNELLNGQLGYREIVTDAFGTRVSDSVMRPGIDGLNIKTTIDAKFQKIMHEELLSFVKTQKFEGGAAAVMDVETGELIVMTSVPEYDANILADGSDRETIAEYSTDSKKPFLNRVVGGSYAPGSVVKPFVAMGILDENLVDPNYRLYTNGILVVPNRFGGPPTYFRDARNNGIVNLVDAIAKSSNIYFFTFSGGFGEHKGLGALKLIENYERFGFGEKTGITEFNELTGFVPSPDWKQETYGEDWLLGDTYYTAIGQYSFLATPLQILVATAAVANEGTILVPKIVKDGNEKVVPDVKRRLTFSTEDFKVVQKGMRATAEYGTAQSLGTLPFTTVAAKTGTAERGANRSKENSWVIGYWPYEEPRYAFVILGDNGPAANNLGVSRVMSQVLRRLNLEGGEEYFKN